MKSRLKKILEIKKRIETNSETAACEETQCWDGWKKKGTKLKGGRLVNNCVKESGLLGRYLLHKKNYDLAADTLSSLMKRKTERKHGVEYYAAIVASGHTGVNTRDLVSHYKSKNNIKESEYNDTEEKNDMAHTQLHFISYASEKIMNLILSGVKVEEWYQNKLSKVHSDMESLYAYMEGTSRKNTMGDTDEDMKEDLRKWFDKEHPEGDWKRINSKGEAVGPCAREPGEPKPKCMSKEKRASLSKKERASAVRAKRKYDPDPERKGAPINVSSDGKGKISEDDIDYITGCPLLERLNPNDGMGTYIRDFSKSDSPQFKGASSSKRRKMAIAAYLGAKRKKLEK
jgi:hypothetical protein